MSGTAADILSPPRRIADIMALAANRPPVRCAGVHPCDAASLGRVIAAAEERAIAQGMLACLAQAGEA